MEFRILGSLEVVDGGVSVFPRPRRPRVLLAMLLTRPNQVLSTDRLIDSLWGERPPPSAPVVLRGYISQLRQALAPGLVLTRTPGYVLAVEPESVDAWRFERLVAEGRAKAARGEVLGAADTFEEALALWRGAALEEFEYEAFAEAPAARLEELRVVATEELAEALLVLGRHQELVGRLTRAADENPLRERVWAQLALTLYRSHRQAEALRMLATVRARLAEELGIDPSAALRRLEQGMLEQRPDLDWSPNASVATVVPNNLPRTLSSLIGRGEELSHLRKLLLEGGLLTLVGSGGVGKTRLTIELGRRLLDRFPDGVWLVELAPIQDPSLLLQAVAVALRVREEPGQPVLDAVIGVLTAKRALVILDNCEHLIGAAATAVDALLRALDTVTWLATSREPLRVEGEVVWRTPSLPVPAADDAAPEAVAGIDAVRLFSERANCHARFNLDADNASAVVQLCRQLDGVPLAIELAAARAGALSPAQILDRLSDRFALLTGGPRPTLPRQQTLRGAVEWSHDLLFPSEQVIFRRLSVFPDSFGLEASEAVGGDAAVASAEVASVIGSLVDKSLILSEQDAGRPRYRLLNTLREYAAERLQEAEESDAVRRRFVRWAVNVVEPATVALERDGDMEAWFHHVWVELDNLTHAVPWALSSDPELGLRLVGSLAPMWGRVGPISDGRQWLEKALAGGGNRPTLPLGRALRWAGRLACLQADHAAARAFLTRSIAVSRELGDSSQEADCLRLLVPSLILEGDFETAFCHLDTAEGIYSELEDRNGEVEILMQRGALATFQGDYALAQRCVSKALSFRRKQGSTSGIARCVNNMGYAALLQGDVVIARPLLEEALELSRATGNWYAVAVAAGNLGAVELQEDSLERATTLFDEELRLARGLGLQEAEAEALEGLGTVAARTGHTTKALDLLTESLRISREHRVYAVPAILGMLGSVALVNGRPSLATEMLGAVSGLSETRALPLYVRRLLQLDEVIELARNTLGESSFSSAWERGRTMSVQDAVMRWLEDEIHAPPR